MDVNPLALKQRLAHLRNSLNALVTERAGLALAAASGDQAASTRIAEIDDERSQLGSQVETIEQALGALKQRATDPLQRIRDGFERDFDHRCRNLKAAVSEQISQLCRHVDQLVGARELHQAAAAWHGDYHNANATYSKIAPPEDVIARVKEVAAVDVCYIKDAELPDSEQFASRRNPALSLRIELIAKLVGAVEIKPPAHLVETHRKLTLAIQQWRDASAEPRRVVPIGRRDK